MSFYVGLAATALRLLTKYGAQYTFTTYTQGAYNVGTGTNSVTTSTYTKYAVKDTYSLFEQNNTAVQKGDLRLIAENGDYTVGDTVVIDSETWRIMSADPIKPAATGVAYVLQVRK